MNYTVYKHVFPNNKIYIGITYQKPEKRWLSGYRYRGTFVGNAIKKYGWENVKHEILYENLTKEQAEQKEIELIAQYKSNNMKFGYNISNGGNHRGKVAEETKQKISQKNRNHKVSEEARRKISQKSKAMWANPEFRKNHLGKTIGIKGKPSWNKGIPQSEEARQKNREKHLGRSAYWNKGKPMPLELKEKLRAINKGRIPWNKGMKNQYKVKDTSNMIKNCHKSKKVICLETGKIYLSGRQCALDMNVDRSSVTRVCNNQLSHSKGFHFKWLDDYSQCTRDNNKLELQVANAILG